jgi:hypothetical protein
LGTFVSVGGDPVVRRSVETANGKDRPMTVTDLVEYLMRRDTTRELALQLAFVHDRRQRGQSAARVGVTG